LTPIQKLKLKIMKKLLSIVAIASFMTACNDSSTTTDTTTTDSTAVDMATPPATMDTSTAMSSAMKEDMMTMKSGKMMVMKNGNWEEMKEEMTCTNGVKVKPNGEVTKGDKKKLLTEGMMIDKEGQMMDENGKMVDESGWN
jgi:hypothetical protein